MQPESVPAAQLFASRAATPSWARRLGRLFSSLVPALGCLGLSAGCGPSRAPLVPPTKLFHGVVLKAACPGEPAATLVNRYCQNWASQTGARVLVVPYDPAAEPEAGLLADLWVLSPA